MRKAPEFLIRPAVHSEVNRNLIFAKIFDIVFSFPRFWIIGSTLCTHVLVSRYLRPPYSFPNKFYLVPSFPDIVVLVFSCSRFGICVDLVSSFPNIFDLIFSYPGFRNLFQPVSSYRRVLFPNVECLRPRVVVSEYLRRNFSHPLSYDLHSTCMVEVAQLLILILSLFFRVLHSLSALI